eukprot:UN19628
MSWNNENNMKIRIAWMKSCGWIRRMFSVFSRLRIKKNKRFNFQKFKVLISLL